MKRVLIAEDHADLRAMTKFMLRSLGCEVIEARDGFEAIEEARENHPDLILMDIAMPILNGITAARVIREDAEIDDVPIIAVTAYGEQYSGKADELGFDELVHKPVDSDRLAELLVQYLDHAGPDNSVN